MYAALISHRQFVTDQLAHHLSSAERDKLYTYHIDRVRDFQHERLIHLIVTCLFTLLLLAAITALLVQPLSELQLTLGLLTAIFFVMELAYVRHYYQLENGVQSLYALTERLREE